MTIGRIAYETWNPNATSLGLIETANRICREYRQQGYDLTLRQLYYQFVARALIPNNQRSYKTLGTVVDKARRAGLLDWDYIVDRTRNLAGFRTYDDPAALISEVAERFHMDLWEDQGVRVEVWVEKEALAGVVARAANSRGCNYFSCRGYVSQSEMHSAALRHRYYENMGQQMVVLHLGDHDPSGIDMTRDITDRLSLFGASTEVHRIALNLDQISQYAPPPNPAKVTDSRFEGYREIYGDESWELDALDPATLNNLIVNNIDGFIGWGSFRDRRDLEQRGRDQLTAVSSRWSEVEDLVEDDLND